MSSFGILSYGAYIPRRRLARQSIFDALGWAVPSLKSFTKGARSFGDWDEDAITMAVAAAQDSFRRLSANAPKHSTIKTIDALTFASTSAPFLDRQNAGIIASALDLPKITHVTDASGSQRVASSALLNANQSRERTTLITSGERRPTKPGSTAEILTGDAGAAILLGTGNPVAEIIGTQSCYADLVDHYRTNETAFDYQLEERWFRDMGLTTLTPQTVTPLLEAASVDLTEIIHIIAPTNNPSLAKAVCDSLCADRTKLAPSLFEECGYSGATHPLLMLAHTLDHAQAGDLILMTAFGQGCDALLVRKLVDLPPNPFGHSLENKVVEENYLKFLSAAGGIDIDRGIRAERDNRTAQTVAFAKSRDVYGFVGGLCQVCGTAQFPKSRRCVNPDCGALDQQIDYSFADRTGTIKSFTEDWLAFTREPPLIYGNVTFEGGGNVFMEMAGFTPGGINIGDAVLPQFRIKDFDDMRGFRRYFWKAGPMQGGQHG